MEIEIENINIININNNNENNNVEKITSLPNKQRKSTKYMTKYERARVLGTRARQISEGAPILVDNEGETDPLMIARKELREKKVPFTIRRKFPNGIFEDWNIDELELNLS